MKKYMLLVCALLLCGCGSDQTSEGKGSHKDAEGEVTTAEVVMKDDKIKDVKIDETTKDTTKRTLKDQYDMKKNSAIGKEWYEQVDYLQTYIKDNGIDNIKFDSEGKATNDDVLSGCTISIEGYVKAVKDAMRDAQ